MAREQQSPRPQAIPVFDSGEARRAWFDVCMNSAANAPTQCAAAATRVANIVRWASCHSRFYAKRYSLWRKHGQPALRDLPPVTKQELMSHIEDSVTDPAITRERIDAFLGDPRAVGTAFLGRYAVWTSSGTSGIPGIFVHNRHALAVYDALEAIRFRHLGSPLEAWSCMIRPERFFLLSATGGHFASNSAVERLKILHPSLGEQMRTASVLDSMASVCSKLNAFHPTIIATYPSAALALGAAAQQGQLRIEPAEIWTGGESLSGSDRAYLTHVFGCPVRNSYGSSEFPPIAFDCEAGQLHLNSDWVILEPVDRNHQPVGRGEQSHTALLTNLANFVQPLIRYDIGDSIRVSPDPCPCGSPFPAIEVEGRQDDVLHFARPGGLEVPITPLALTQVMEDMAGLYCFQLIQPDASSLGVRLAIAGDPQPSWHRVHQALTAYLRSQGLASVRVFRDAIEPQLDPRSGKCRRVIARKASDARRAVPSG
jgi:phenylacetate-CoA ligase